MRLCVIDRLHRLNSILHVFIFVIVIVKPILLHVLLIAMQIARNHNLLIMEDDPYYFLQFSKVMFTQIPAKLAVTQHKEPYNRSVF